MPPHPTAFTATYNVSQGGEPMGVATVTLRAADNGEWIYSKDVKGTGGLAAMLGASMSESSRFRWKGDVPEAISYDYQLQTRHQGQAASPVGRLGEASSDRR